MKENISKIALAMKFNKFLLVLGLTAIGLTTASKEASALNWSIGTSSSTSTTLNSFRRGQSFTPNVSGSSGLGTPGATAYLQSFTFGANSSGNLYIYDRQYNGPSLALGSGSGLVGISSTADNTGTYNFGDSGLLLSSVSSPFYAYTNSNFSSSYSENIYSGGFYYNAISPGTPFMRGSDRDWNFSATFTDTPTQAVPWNIEPGQGIALGLPLFIGLRMLKRKIASKRTTSKFTKAIS